MVKAYAILDGGGVKGAALAGCLQAAWEKGIEFQGYGGTSAGAIVALLACIGYRGKELRSLVEKIDFSEFLDDGGADLQRLRTIAEGPWSKLKLIYTLFANRDLLAKLQEHFGLYTARELVNFLNAKMIEKFPDLQREAEIDFEHLKRLKCPLLKIMVSDLGVREPRIYSGQGGEERNGPVIDAVRASMSYPFVFRPVKVNDRYLVDGGISSNLPIFMFDAERQHTRLPVIAFDLVASKRPISGAWTLSRFCSDLLATSLESGDNIVGKVIRGVYHIRIPVPEDVDTLDFRIDAAKRSALYDRGKAEAYSFLERNMPQWASATSVTQSLQALHSPPARINPILKAVSQVVEKETSAQDTRVYVLLPTAQGTLAVAYRYKFANDAGDVERSLEQGWWGKVWKDRAPLIVDLAPDGKVTKTQNVQPRKSVFCTPIFEPDLGAKDVRELSLMGLLVVDTASSLGKTGWTSEYKGFMIGLGKQWADILSKVLS